MNWFCSIYVSQYQWREGILVPSLGLVVTMSIVLMFCKRLNLFNKMCRGYYMLEHMLGVQTNMLLETGEDPPFFRCRSFMDCLWSVDGDKNLRCGGGLGSETRAQNYMITLMTFFNFLRALEIVAKINHLVGNPPKNVCVQQSWCPDMKYPPLPWVGSLSITSDGGEHFFCHEILHVIIPINMLHFSIRVIQIVRSSGGGGGSAEN